MDTREKVVFDDSFETTLGEIKPGNVFKCLGHWKLVLEHVYYSDPNTDNETRVFDLEENTMGVMDSDLEVEPVVAALTIIS